MTPPRLVGMVHLPALPGRPNHDGRPLGEIAEAAVREAATLEEGGFDAVLLQNSLDRPTRERVDAATVAQLTRIARDIRDATRITLGINVHKNDGPAAIAIAAAAETSFVRVKVHTGAVLSAEGIVTGCAEETLTLRSRLGLDHTIEIWADIDDPTSRQLPGDTLERAAVDALDFGAADAVIVTQPTVEDSCRAIERLRDRFPSAAFIIGGKTTHDNIRTALQTADGVIVGSALKTQPGIAGDVDPSIVERFVQAAGTA
jgi:uncharacterized protein